MQYVVLLDEDGVPVETFTNFEDAATYAKQSTRATTRPAYVAKVIPVAVYKASTLVSEVIL